MTVLPKKYTLMRKSLIKNRKGKKMFSKIRTAVLVMLVVLALAGCGAQSSAATNPPAAATTALSPAKLADGAKLKVVATTTIVGDLVKNVAGDLVDLRVVLPVGADSHSFQPTPQDIAKVADANVVFVNGFGLEQFLETMIKDSGTAAPVVSLADGIKPRTLAPAEHDEDEESGEHGEADHNHGGVDPHIWVSPANAKIMVENVARALAQVDPAHAETYRANAAAYQQKLAELDRWVQAEVDKIPAANRKLVADHKIFGYFTDRYGFEQVGAVVPAFSTGAEPSAQDLAALQNAVRQSGVKAIFVGTTVNPALSSRLADDAGIKLVKIYTESLGESGSGVESYLDYIRFDTTAMVNALK